MRHHRTLIVAENTRDFVGVDGCGGVTLAENRGNDQMSYDLQRDAEALTNDAQA